MRPANTTTPPGPSLQRAGGVRPRPIQPAFAPEISFHRCARYLVDDEHASSHRTTRAGGRRKPMTGQHPPPCRSNALCQPWQFAPLTGVSLSAGQDAPSDVVTLLLAALASWTPIRPREIQCWPQPQTAATHHKTIRTRIRWRPPPGWTHAASLTQTVPQAPFACNGTATSGRTRCSSHIRVLHPRDRGSSGAKHGARATLIDRVLNGRSGVRDSTARECARPSPT